MTTQLIDWVTTNPKFYQYCASVAVTDAATIATDCSQGNYFTVTLAGNRTLGAPTNMAMADGRHFFWQFTQDGSGSRTMAYNAIFYWAGGTATALSTAAASVDLLTTVYSATLGKFMVISLTKALAHT